MELVALRVRVGDAVRLRVRLLLGMLEGVVPATRFEEDGVPVVDATREGVLLGGREGVVVGLANAERLAEAGREAEAEAGSEAEAEAGREAEAEAGCKAEAKAGREAEAKCGSVDVRLADGDAEDEDELEEESELELLDVAVCVGPAVAKFVATPAVRDGAKVAVADSVDAAVPV